MAALEFVNGNQVIAIHSTHESSMVHHWRERGHEKVVHNDERKYMKLQLQCPRAAHRRLFSELLDSYRYFHHEKKVYQ